MTAQHNESVTISNLSLSQAAEILERLREQGYVCCRREPIEEAPQPAEGLEQQLREHTCGNDDCWLDVTNVECVGALVRAEREACAEDGSIAAQAFVDDLDDGQELVAEKLADTVSNAIMHRKTI